MQYLGRTGAGAVAAKGKVTTGGGAEVKGKAKEDVLSEEDDFEADAFGDEMEIGQVTSAVEASSSSSSAAGSGASSVDLTGRKAHGQAWGVLFWNGECCR